MITGTATGTVTEAGGVTNGTPGTPTATGDLKRTDVDNPADTFQAVAAGDRERQRLRQLRARQRPGCGPTRSTTAMPTVQALNVGRHADRHASRR